MKIQLEPGQSSSMPEPKTQAPASTVLSQRSLARPSNLTLEAAASSTRSEYTSDFSRPSRLVNLRLHDSDLISARPVKKSEKSPAEAKKPTPAAEKPKVLIEPARPIAEEPPSAVRVDVTTEDVVQEMLAENQEKASDDFDSTSLKMNIAADYTEASLGASVAALPTKVENSNDDLSIAVQEAKVGDSIDEIARTASEAIAAIRAATDPADIAAQIESLKTFAAHIRKNADIPEIIELGDTIDKFIKIAEKSTGVQLEQAKKAKEDIKISSTSTPKATESLDTAIKSATTAKKVFIGRSAAKPIATTSTKPVASPAAKTTSRFGSRTAKTSRITRPLVTKTTKAKTPARRATVTSDDAALKKALRSVAEIDKAETKTAPKVRRHGNGRRFALALGCALLCVSAIIYFVGTNIPDISVRVAAMQTGVEARYPSYIPRDYSLKGISSEDGKISMSFVGPNDSSFTLVEEKSSWDSATLLRNYVSSTWGENYTTTHEQGITIYTSGSNAAWVNGGVLYKINSSSNSLTAKQLRNIVTSLQ